MKVGSFGTLLCSFQVHNASWIVFPVVFLQWFFRRDFCVGFDFFGGIFFAEFLFGRDFFAGILVAGILVAGILHVSPFFMLRLVHALPLPIHARSFSSYGLFMPEPICRIILDESSIIYSIQTSATQASVFQLFRPLSQWPDPLAHWYMSGWFNQETRVFDKGHPWNIDNYRCN